MDEPLTMPPAEPELGDRDSAIEEPAGGRDDAPEPELEERELER